MLLLDCRLRPLTVADLPLILGWRNHSEVRRWMYTDREIPSEEHLQWFNDASKDGARSLLIFECRRKAQGFVNLHRITDWGLGEWGFYIAPGAAKGTGRALGTVALRYAFEILSLHKLCGEVIATNTRSLRFHEKLGFQCEGILREQHFDGKSYQDVHCYGLLASEWHSICYGDEL